MNILIVLFRKIMCGMGVVNLKKLAAFVLIILSGLNYNVSNQNFFDNPFGVLGGTQLYSSVVMFFIGLLGIIGFLYNIKFLLIIFVILLGLASILIFAVSIFGFVAGSHYSSNLSLGCDTKLQALTDLYNTIDSYLIQADQYFCSRDCPCYMDGKTQLEFSKIFQLVPYYNQWFKTFDNSYPNNFDLCPPQVKSNAKNNYLSFINFDPQLFGSYWGVIESKFECVQLCTGNYFNEMTNTNEKMIKYLFSDINKGIPKNLGCLNIILEMVSPYLFAYGSIGIFVSLFDFIILYTAISLLCVKTYVKIDEEEVENIVQTVRVTDGNENINTSKPMIEMVKHIKTTSDSNLIKNVEDNNEIEYENDNQL